MFYSVVLLDGKERQNLSFDEVKDLFFKRQINQNSLICSNDNPRWQMLKRVFDVTGWIPLNAPQNFNQATLLPTTVNPFAQPAAAPVPASQPVTFNQFPPNPPVQTNNPSGQNTSNGYSQNNQSETYYQAETTQTNYNFQKNETNFAPSRYNNPANSYNFQPARENYSVGRRGARQAAVFLIINAFLYVIYNISASLFSASGGTDDSEKLGQGVGRSIIPLIIDLYLASKLWKQDNVESARKWVLVRSYFGFIVFGLIIPFLSIKTGEISVGIFSFVSMFFYFISLAFVLHGKENPSKSRVMVGVGTYAVYFLVMFGTISLSVLGNLAPDLARIDPMKNSQIEKYKIEGKEFQDNTTGAKVVLPEGWSMIALDNPVVHTPEARMIAVDNAGNRLTMLEVVPVPGNLDMKRANSVFILDTLADSVVQSLKNEAQNSSGFGSKNLFNEITRLNIYIGTHPAKLLIFEKTNDGLKARGQMIITYDELTFYVLHSWCPAEDYENARNDFTFFEKNFTVPEKINSPFTQTAESEKKR